MNWEYRICDPVKNSEAFEQIYPNNGSLSASRYSGISIPGYWVLYFIEKGNKMKRKLIFKYRDISFDRSKIVVFHILDFYWIFRLLTLEKTLLFVLILLASPSIIHSYYWKTSIGRIFLLPHQIKKNILPTRDAVLILI